MKNKLIIGLILFLLLGVFYFTSNRRSSNESLNQSKSNKLQIIGSYYPVYFFASQIGGDKADVVNLTPVGAEPHDYEPTTQQMAKISKSDMLVLNGGTEPWGDRIKDQLAGTDVLVVVGGEGLINKEFEEEGKKVLDPHVYMDPVLAKKEVGNIEKGFERIDPNNSKYYQQNAKSLMDKLDQLDMDYKKGLQNCEKKDFITSHDAFGYLASRYGINQVAISGVSPDEEPSAQKLAEIADLVKRKNIKVIFFESLVSPKLSQTIARETGASTLVLDPIEGISKENLKNGVNYFTVMKANLNNLQIALECK